MVGAALGSIVLEEVCAYLAFTLAIPTTKRSLIIRTEIRTTSRERLKIKLIIWALDISPDYRQNPNSVKRQIRICMGSERTRNALPARINSGALVMMLCYEKAMIVGTCLLTECCLTRRIPPIMNLAFCSLTVTTSLRNPREACVLGQK